MGNFVFPTRISKVFSLAFPAIPICPESPENVPSKKLSENREKSRIFAVHFFKTVTSMKIGKLETLAKTRLSGMFVAIVCLCVGCKGGYSFTGASIPADAKTISVATFPNYATMVYPQLSQVLSDGLRNTFSSQTNLVVTNNGGDLDISGEITGYTMQPTAITSNDQAAMNRLTITIKVKFVNSKDPKANFEQSFSRYKEFSSSLNFSSVESSLVDEIVTELIDDVFTKSVVNW